MDNACQMDVLYVASLLILMIRSSCAEYDEQHSMVS